MIDLARTLGDTDRLGTSGLSMRNGSFSAMAAGSAGLVNRREKSTFAPRPVSSVGSGGGGGGAGRGKPIER